MNRRYEYEFVRIGEGWLGAKRSAMHEYQDVVHKYARAGWRLVQVFAPSMGSSGTSKYFEIIFEREV